MEESSEVVMEQIRHEETIDQLCQEFPDQVDFIRRQYLEVLERVSSEASIRTYLTILIAKEVRTLLRMQQLTAAE
jgi:hypothetical protein